MERDDQAVAGMSIAEGDYLWSHPNGEIHLVPLPWTQPELTCHAISSMLP